ncbi:hypothetical protein FHG87_012771 [Trinorchestia longiramus]|nr:hypothetical protein FHG87_012771 [Trinorchestia longiramus]
MEEELEKFLSSQSLGTFLLDADTESLLKDVKEKRATLRAAEIRREDLTDDLKKREDELKNLRTMLGQIQDLWESHKEQVEAEISLEAEAQREISSLRQTCTHTQKNLLQVQENTERLRQLQLECETEAHRLQEQVAGYTELVEGLLEKLAELDKDHILLLQYSAADDASLKKVFVELEKCGEAVARSEVALEEARHEEAAQQSAQRSLASAFVSAAERRDELLLKWELCLSKLSEKGKEQKATVQSVLELKDKIKEAEKSEMEEATFQERLQSSCKTLERKLVKKRKFSSELYQEIHETETSKLELAAQEAGLQSALGKTSQLTTGSVHVCKKEKTLAVTTEDLQAVLMACDNCDREKRRLTNESEATAVQYTLQQLQLRQRHAEGERIRSAAQQLNASRLQMHQLIEEQCQNVRTKIQEREKELRNLEQSLHDETLVLHQNTTKLSQLHNRYSEIRSSLGANKEEETEVTAARAIIKVEQDALGLQEAEHLVEEAVHEAREDLEALNVLLQEARREGKHLRYHLHSFFTGAEERPRLELEAEISQIQTQILECQKNKSDIREELQGTRRRLQEVELQLRAVEDLLNEKSVHAKAVERELVDQQLKMAHARDAVASLLRRTRHEAQMHPDIELRVTQESLCLVNQHLGRLANDNPDLAAAIVLYCQQANIPPPRLLNLARDKAFGLRSSSSSASLSGGSDEGLSTHRSVDSGSGSTVASPSKASGRKRTPSGKQSSKIIINEIKAELPANGTPSAGWPQPSFKGRTLRLPPSHHR